MRPRRTDPQSQTTLLQGTLCLQTINTRIICKPQTGKTQRTEVMLRLYTGRLTKSHKNDMIRVLHPFKETQQPWQCQKVGYSDMRKTAKRGLKQDLVSIPLISLLIDVSCAMLKTHTRNV